MEKEAETAIVHKPMGLNGIVLYEYVHFNTLSMYSEKYITNVLHDVGPQRTTKKKKIMYSLVLTSDYLAFKQRKFCLNRKDLSNI